jgi:hypothetical protein
VGVPWSGIRNSTAIATISGSFRIKNRHVIMMSGVAPTAYFWRATHRDYLAMAEALGATRTIEKPFKYSQLIRLVHECLA